MIDWVQLSIGFVLGMAGGQFLRFERVPRKGHTILRPRLEHLTFDKRWLNLVLASMFILSTAQVTWWTFRQRACNTDFQSTTIELRSIANEDRELERQDDALRNLRDDAMSALVKGLITPSPEGVRVNPAELLNKYSATLSSIDVQRDQLYAKRADLEKQRQMHALPPKERC